MTFNEWLDKNWQKDILNSKIYLDIKDILIL